MYHRTAVYFHPSCNYFPRKAADEKCTLLPYHTIYSYYNFTLCILYPFYKHHMHLDNTATVLKVVQKKTKFQFSHFYSHLLRQDTFVLILIIARNSYHL